VTFDYQCSCRQIHGRASQSRPAFPVSAAPASLAALTSGIGPLSKFGEQPTPTAMIGLRLRPASFSSSERVVRRAHRCPGGKLSSGWHRFGPELSIVVFSFSSLLAMSVSSRNRKSDVVFRTIPTRILGAHGPVWLSSLRRSLPPGFVTVLVQFL